MSGRCSLTVADLYTVCAHWLQAAGPYQSGLYKFGLPDPAVAHVHIDRVLR